MASTTVTLLLNGPAKIEGDFQLLDASGQAFDLGAKKAIYLCRCGQSAKKPLCDGAHKACGFLAGEAAGAL